MIDMEIFVMHTQANCNIQCLCSVNKLNIPFLLLLLDFLTVAIDFDNGY